MKNKTQLAVTGEHSQGRVEEVTDMMKEMEKKNFYGHEMMMKNPRSAEGSLEKGRFASHMFPPNFDSLVDASVHGRPPIDVNSNSAIIKDPARYRNRHQRNTRTAGRPMPSIFPNSSNQTPMINIQ